MPDERIAAVLARAAKDRAFFDALMANRASALAACDLTEAERALLMAPTRTQLSKMIEQARKKPWNNLARAGFFAGGVAAAVGFTGLLGAPLLVTMGHTCESMHDSVAQSTLRQVAHAENLYRFKFGSYGSLDDLAENNYFSLSDKHVYRVEIEADADTFAATARHRTRPETRPAFRVGPDGEVKPVE